MIARQYLANIYGDEVCVEYYDASRPETQVQFPEALKAAEQQKHTYPIVVMDGEVRTSGGVSAYQLMFLVDQDRKEKGLSTKF